MTVSKFVRDSWAIEGYTNLNDDEVQKIADLHRDFWTHNFLTIEDLQNFVSQISDGELRIKQGMDVSVGNHLPMFGGPSVGFALQELLDEFNSEDYEMNACNFHRRFESLHPFTDGNGRVGRALFMKMINEDQMQTIHRYGFLQGWYYLSLEMGV